jgi:hypothetical protein
MSEAGNSELEAARAEARRKVQGMRAFYIHALVYAVVITMLIVINLLSGDGWKGNWWVQWPAMTWGAVLILHGIFAHGGADLFGADWEERKVDELVNRKRSV